jgi:hypothetical protein
MRHCLWKPIDAFQSPAELRRFETWLAEQVQDGQAEQVQVRSRYANATTLNERRFRHKPSGKVWRGIDPDTPFLGTFEPV